MTEPMPPDPTPSRRSTSAALAARSPRAGGFPLPASSPASCSATLAALGGSTVYTAGRRSTSASRSRRTAAGSVQSSRRTRALVREVTHAETTIERVAAATGMTTSAAAQRDHDHGGQRAACRRRARRPLVEIGVRGRLAARRPRMPPTCSRGDLVPDRVGLRRHEDRDVRGPARAEPGRSWTRSTPQLAAARAAAAERLAAADSSSSISSLDNDQAQQRPAARAPVERPPAALRSPKNVEQASWSRAAAAVKTRRRAAATR